MAEPQGIGPFLKERRERTGRSLSALAREAGVSKSTLSTWERGLRQPCVPELDAVLTILDPSEDARDEALALVDAPRARRALGETVGASFRPELMVALRSRMGMDQEELAHRLGIRQSTVSRWERGENEPSRALLRRFATIAGASDSEWNALTRPAPYGDGTALDDLEIRFQRIAFEAPMPKDVEFLLLRRALAKADCVQGRRMRARVAIRHAQCLAECGRVRETISSALDANTLAARENFGTDALVPVAIAEASVTRSPDRALRILGQVGSLADPVLRAWIADERGYHLSRAGRPAEALDSARVGVEIARAEGRPVERYFRARGASRVFLRAGRYEETARLLEEPRPEGLPPSALDHLVPMRLAIALRQPEAATRHREEATRLAHREGRLLNLVLDLDEAASAR